MAVKNTKNYHNDGFYRFLVYGAPGSGKTRMTTTIPGNPLIILTEPEGQMSLAGHDLDYFEVKTAKDMLDATKEASNPKYDWVVLDSVSALSSMYLKEQIKASNDKRAAYGNMAEITWNRVRELFALPKHFYCISRLVASQDEAGQSMFGVALEGQKLKSDIPHDFSFVFKMTTIKNKEGKEVMALQTRKDEANKDLKDRSGVLNKYEPAHLGKLIKKIQTNFNTNQPKGE